MLLAILGTAIGLLELRISMLTWAWLLHIQLAVSALRLRHQKLYAQTCEVCHNTDYFAFCNASLARILMVP